MTRARNKSGKGSAVEEPELDEEQLAEASAETEEESAADDAGPVPKKRKRRKQGAAARKAKPEGRSVSDFLLGGEVDEETSARFGELRGLALMGASLFLLLALLSYRMPFKNAMGESIEGHNWCGQAGFYLASFSHSALGWASLLLCFLGLSWGFVLLTRKQISLPVLRFASAVVCLFSTAFLLQLALGSRFAPSNSLPYGPGGWLALQLIGPDSRNPYDLPLLVEKLGTPGLWVFLPLVALTSFMLATEMAFLPAWQALERWREESRERRGEGLRRASWRWFLQMCSGLWAFLRGADLETEAEPAEQPKRKRRSKEAKAEEQAAVSQGASAPAAGQGAVEGESDLEDGEESSEQRAHAEAARAAAAAREAAEREEEEEDDEEQEEIEALAAVLPAPLVVKPHKQLDIDARRLEPIMPPRGPWKFPPIDLLEPPDKRKAEDQKGIEQAAAVLQNVLGSFQVKAQVVAAQVGPTVILYELEVESGTRMNKVTQLSNEIAGALRAKSVRIIAPIPGKSTIGIEVPNSGRRTVRISELVTQRAYDSSKIALPIFLGMDTEGNAMVEDLARAPHLLIAGTTGSGKSVCINTILASLLLTRSPHDVQLILVDPKMVELMIFANVPHLMLPVVTDAKQATKVLEWAVEKMEGRYDLFKNAGVKNIKSYNALSEQELKQRMGEEWNELRTPRHVPYIVVIIDEMADLMMVSKKEAEMSITRLAQKSRAVGIHVVVATQRPSTDVITGVIKGNLPTRIAFQVASKIDSRVILDASGAEKLLGQGDMLYTPPQSSQIRRVQGALVEDHELQALVDFVCQEAAPNFSQELVQAATGSAGPAGEGDELDPEEDELWDEAVRVILQSRRGSASLLQRALGVGYTRASRLIDIMTAQGILGEFKGSKAREVMMTLDQWEEQHGSPRGRGASSSAGRGPSSADLGGEDE